MFCAQDRPIGVVIDRHILWSPPQQQRKAIGEQELDHHPEGRGPSFDAPRWGCGTNPSPGSAATFPRPEAARRRAASWRQVRWKSRSREPPKQGVSCRGDLRKPSAAYAAYVHGPLDTTRRDCNAAGVKKVPSSVMELSQADCGDRVWLASYGARCLRQFHAELKRRQSISQRPAWHAHESRERLAQVQYQEHGA